MRIWPKNAWKEILCFNDHFLCVCVCVQFFIYFFLAFDHTYVCVCVCVCVQLLTAVGLSYLLQTEWVDPSGSRLVYSTTRFKQFPPSFSFLSHKSVREREKNKKKMEREKEEEEKRDFHSRRKPRWKTMIICPFVRFVSQALPLSSSWSFFIIIIINFFHFLVAGVVGLSLRNPFALIHFERSIINLLWWPVFSVLGGSCRMVMVRTHLPEATPAETLFSSPVNSPLHLFCQRLWFSLSVRGFHSTAAVRFVNIMVAVVSSFPFVSVLSLIRPMRY